ncbi:MAG TPA: hypothetical protein VFA33_09525 [Bryobacteraceae bacterium]|nr:hypothetical protein [Bryobacteraceae bacterium]
MFVFDPPADRYFGAQVRRLLARLPALEGGVIRVEARGRLRGAGGAIHAGAFLRQRRIAFDRNLSRDGAEFGRIFVHEVAHFAWIRLSNARRRSWEDLLREEMARGALGELGWSAEWRKEGLEPVDLHGRTRRWREYVCESFCDTAAWCFAPLANHPEFTLAGRWRRRRRDWFAHFLVTKRMSI